MAAGDFYDCLSISDDSDASVYFRSGHFPAYGNLLIIGRDIPRRSAENHAQLGDFPIFSLFDHVAHISTRQFSFILLVGRLVEFSGIGVVKL